MNLGARPTGQVRWGSVVFWGFVAVTVVKQVALTAAVDPTALRSGGRTFHLVAVTAALALSTAAPARLAAGRRQAATLLAVTLVLTGFAYADVLYYRQFQLLPTFASLRYARQLVDFRAGITPLLRASDLWLWLDLALLLPFALIRPLGHRLRPLPVLRASLLCTLGFLLFTFAVVRRPNLRLWRGASYKAGSINLIGYHAFDALMHLAWSLAHPAISPTMREAALARLDAAAAEPSSELFGAARGRNVIVIQLESAQGFAFELRTPAGPVTPNLDALARESITFPHAFHQAAEGVTSDAQFAANCSLLPPGESPAAYSYADRTLGCLPRVLAGAGYRTHAFQTLAPDLWNAAAIQEAMGFERSYSGRDFVQDETIGLGLSDGSMLRQMVGKLERLEEPYYALMLTLTSHTPFDVEGLPPFDVGEFEGDIVGRYLQTLHYTDRAIGEFVAALRSRGILDRSVLVIYGDHHALTRRTARLERALPLPPASEHGWFAEEKRVPLLIRLPYGAAAAPRPSFASQIDIAPTLLSLLGIARTGTVMLGRDLLSPARTADEPVVFPEGSVLSPDRLWSTSTGGRCYGRADELPAERCADLEALAREELTLSRTMADGATLAWLAAQGRGQGAHARR